MEAKKIIITGGATRIGAVIAKSLVSFDTKIVIHFNRSKNSALKLKKELENLGAETYLLKADLNNFKPSVLPNIFSLARSGCGINPMTLPAGFVIPAISATEPFGLLT